MKRNTLYLLATLLAASFVADTSWARERGEGRGRHKGHHKMMMKQLDLNPEQRKEMKDIRKAYRDDLKALRENIQTEQKKLHDLMKGNADDAQILSQHDKVHGLRGDMMKKRLEMMLKIRAKLTPEQRQKFAESLPEMPHGGRGKHRGMGGPPDDDFMGLEDDEE